MLQLNVNRLQQQNAKMIYSRYKGLVKVVVVVLLELVPSARVDRSAAMCSLLFSGSSPARIQKQFEREQLLGECSRALHHAWQKFQIGITRNRKNSVGAECKRIQLNKILFSSEQLKNKRARAHTQYLDICITRDEYL